MAAHLQGLTGEGSSIAIGDYVDPSVNQLVATPEPASMILLGSGAVAAALSRRRRRKTAE